MENQENEKLDNLTNNPEDIEEVSSEYLKKYLLVAKMVASGDFKVQEEEDGQ